jgi:hypothetical protein
VKKRTETHACDYQRKKTKKPEAQTSGSYIPRTAERTPWIPGKKHDIYIISSKKEKTRAKKDRSRSPDL